MIINKSFLKRRLSQTRVNHQCTVDRNRFDVIFEYPCIFVSIINLIENILMNYFHKLNKNIISQDVATYQGILLHQSTSQKNYSILLDKIMSGLNIYFTKSDDDDDRVVYGSLFSFGLSSIILHTYFRS